MKLWIDDWRSPTTLNHWCWVRSVNDAKRQIEIHELYNDPFDLISIDHDAGDYFQYGGDYIRLLDWLEETSRNYPIHIHSMNVVGVQNMRAIIQHNGWKEIRY